METYSNGTLVLPDFAETWKPSYIKERAWDKFFYVLYVDWADKASSVALTSRCAPDVTFSIDVKDDCQEKRWESYCRVCREVLYKQLRSGLSADDLLKKYACMGTSNVRRFTEMWERWKGNSKTDKTVYRG